MPYICRELRKEVDNYIAALIDELESTDENERAGYATYIIYKLIAEVYGYWLPKWHQKAEGIKIFECAKLEYYRRIIAPHEDKAKEKNGDV